METIHRSVLLAEIIEALAGDGSLSPGVIFDGTLGGGGHSEALLERFPEAKLLGVDRDEAALERAAARLERFGDRFFCAHGTYDELLEIWEKMPEAARTALGESKRGTPRFDAMLLDLGISSDQLDCAERGFAFSHDGPLDMRMDRSRGETAADILNASSESDLRQIFRTGGVNESFARTLARETVRRRPFSRTFEFAALCDELTPARHKYREGGRPKNAATVPFQALRMQVNDELGGIERFLNLVPEVLAPGGRLAVISFHSLEDKAVAQRMRLWSRPGPGDARRAGPSFGTLLTRQAVVPSDEESAANPRARSARLRVFQRGEE